MSPSQDEEVDVDVDWKAVIALLRDGKMVEIPCEKERDYVRRENQVVKRAEKKGIVVAVHRGDGVLRIEPQVGSGPERDASATAMEFQGDRQLERHQRREVLRAERARDD
jgi:hypothetical protein